MKINDEQTIEKYLKINILSKREAYFVSDHVKGKKATGRLTLLRGDQFVFETEQEFDVKKGHIYFYSFTFIFKFRTSLTHSENNVFTGKIPQEVILDDRRGYPRLIYDSIENKVITIIKDGSEEEQKAILVNVCGTGVGIVMPDYSNMLKKGDVFYIKSKVLGKTLVKPLEVVFMKNRYAGCHFNKATIEFIRYINKFVLDEIEWRSENLLTQLLSKSLIIEKVYNLEASKTYSKSETINYLNLVNPFLESAVSVVDSFLGIKLIKKEVKLEKISSGKYDASTYFNCEGSNVNFQFFLCFYSDVIMKISEIVFGSRPDSINDEVKDLLGELGNMIAGNAKNNLDENYHYKMTTPGLLIGKRYVLSTLSQFPSVRVVFDSDIGEFDIVLFIGDIVTSLEGSSNNVSFDQNDLTLLEPIFDSAVNLFSNFLGFEMREKSTKINNPLYPKFDISAFLDVTGKGFEGRFVLNLSKSLAFKIYEHLVSEKVDEFNEYVKDAVGEMINIISGNAKQAFEEMGLHYMLSTPFIVEGKQQIIKNTSNVPFVSSVYWVSGGFLELSLSLYRKS